MGKADALQFIAGVARMGLGGNNGRWKN